MPRPVADTVPQTSDQVVAAEHFDWSGGSLEPGIGLALSGGGFRAMLFHAGSLLRLNELGLLSKVDRVASVSGGSITAGLLAAAWDKLGPPEPDGSFARFRELVLDPLVGFSHEKLDVMNALTGLLPFTSASEEVAESYDDLLFKGVTLQDIPDQPRFVFCATNLQTGVLWRFSKPYAGDYVIGFIPSPTIRLAEAVAASSAFPPILSPMTLELDPSEFRDWPSRPGETPLKDRHAYRHEIMLTDGGVYDNHGMEPIVKRYMTLLVADGGAPFARTPDVASDWLRQLRRVLDLTDNQVRALRRRDLVSRFKAGNAAFDAGTLGAGDVRTFERLGAYWGIDTDPSAALAPAGCLPCQPARVDPLAAVSTRLSDLGHETTLRLVNWGYAICDRSVRTHLRGQDLVTRNATWPFPAEKLG